MSQSQQGIPDSKNHVTSGFCRGIFKNDDVFVREATPEMYEFFGMSPELPDQGILCCISKHSGPITAQNLRQLFQDNRERGDSFRLVCPAGIRIDGTPCMMQIDAYAREKTADGVIYDVIGMDVSDAHRTQTDEIYRENRALTEDSPIGMGIYYIRGDQFDLVYTNREYYRIHHGSKAFWDKFKGKDAMDRIVPEDRASIYQEWHRMLGVEDAAERVFDVKYRVRGEDEGLHWVQLRGRLADEVAGVRVCYASYIDIDEQKQAVAKAEAAGRNLLNAITNLPVAAALYVFDPATGDAVAGSFTDGFCDMCQISQEQVWLMYGDDAYKNVYPEDRIALRKYFGDHINDYNQPLQFTYRVMIQDGKYKWVQANFKIFPLDGKTYIYTIYTDFDEIKAQEEAVIRQYLEAQASLDAVADTFVAIYRINFTQNQVELIRGMETGIIKEKKFTADELSAFLTQGLPRKTDRIPERLLLNRQQALSDYEEGKTNRTTEQYYKFPDGRGRWLRTSRILTRRPGSWDIIGFVTVENINNLKTIQLLMHDVLVHQFDFIVSIDTGSGGFEIISSNEESTRAWDGRDDGDFNTLSRDYADACMETAEKQRWLEFSRLKNVVGRLKDKDTLSAVFEVRENGELRYKRMDFYYLNRGIDRIVLIQTDYTGLQKEQQAHEENMRIALTLAEQASVAKTEFLSRMSHEIRTPMNAIIGLDIIALQEQNLSKNMEDNLTKIGISARFLLSLINDILDMSRIESGRILLRSEVFDFGHFLDSVTTILNAQCRDKGLVYECIIKGVTEERYIGDALKLQQVLINMLGNAVKFTPSGGKVQLIIEQIGRSENDAQLRFTIRDTGMGMSEDFLPHIFEAFSQENSHITNSYGGSGLGLSISKHLVQLMNGDIDVKSVQGQGSTFTVTVCLKLSEDRQPQWVSGTIALYALKTLIVDDNVIDCQHAEIVLKQAGIAAEWINSGVRAVKLVTSRHEAGNDFKLILIDWKMPDMDGVETAREIRRIVGPDVTILILTAYDWSEIEERARNAGIDSFLRKPIFVSDVIQAYDDVHRHHDEVKEKKHDFSGKRILLVEDNQINSEIAKKILENQGFDVDLAWNGIEAVEKFAHSTVGEYAAILMDIRMPLMDGLQAARLIRDTPKDDAGKIPVIALSASAFEEDVRKSMAAGMNAHLSKPLDSRLLFTTLHKLIFPSS